MGIHNTPHKLALAVFPAEGRDTYVEGRGYLRAWGAANPTNTVSGYAPGCIYHQFVGDGDVGHLWYNSGTSASANWAEVAVRD